MRKDASAEEPSPGKRIWSLFSEEDRRKLRDWGQDAQEGENPKFFQGIETLRTALNLLVHSPELYDQAAWSKVSLSQECRDYLALERKKLTTSELARMNRLLIEEEFRASFSNCSLH